MCEKKVRYICFVAAGVLLTMLISLLVLHAKPRVSCSARIYGLIKAGMTKSDVENAVHGAPGEYTSGPWYSFPIGAYRNRDGEHWETWVADDGRLEVMFDSDGRVVEKEFNPVGLIDQSLWSRLRFYLAGLLKR
jgi:hypothetical protein